MIYGIKKMKRVYDYVVVGAGAGGCPVVARLVEAGMNVLLIEGGPSNDVDFIRSGKNIGDMFSLWGSQYDWKYQTKESEKIYIRYDMFHTLCDAPGT